jgi:hypothetical protein
MIRWFKALPTYRKVVLFLAGGMVSLVFDAFVAHFQWNNRTMKWNQTIPVVYGLVALVALAVVALVPLRGRRSIRLGQAIGALGILVGGAGVFFHGKSLFNDLDADSLGIVAIGKLLASGPPLFAPSAFAGVGLLLLTLPAILGIKAEARRERVRLPTPTASFDANEAFTFYGQTESGVWAPAGGAPVNDR